MGRLDNRGEGMAGPAWGRLKNETASRYNWFVMYCELGPEMRSTAAVASRIGIAEKHIIDASERYRWSERVAAYDDDVRGAVMVADPDAVLAGQYAIGMMMMRLGISALGLKNPALMKVNDIQKIVTAGAELARKGTGLADMKIETERIERVQGIIEAAIAGEIDGK